MKDSRIQYHGDSSLARDMAATLNPSPIQIETHRGDIRTIQRQFSPPWRGRGGLSVAMRKLSTVAKISSVAGLTHPVLRAPLRGEELFIITLALKVFLGQDW